MKFLKYVLIFVCFIPLLFFRDFTPNNELKYLSIADEAIRNGSIFTFWNHGEVYADKPPLYLWIVMLGKWLCGDHCMFFLGLFSLLPALLILYIMDKWTASYLPESLRNSGQLMLITSGSFVGSAIVLRMDMLMCLFIVLSLYTFYKLYSGRASRFDSLKLPVYIFLAVFTKGPVGILVPLLTIPTFLFFQGKLRHFGRYLGWKQWGIMLGLSLLWFAGVFFEGGTAYLNNLLFNQTVNRAIDSFHHKEPIWYYFKTIWYSLAPWVIFYVATILIGLKQRLIDTDLKKLFLTVITTTFIALSLSSGKLDIYLLPIFPFIAYLAFLIFPEIQEKWVRFSIAIPAVILLLAFPGLFIAGPYIDLPVLKILPIPLACLVLTVFSGLSLLRLKQKRFLNATNHLAIGLLLAIFIGSFSLRTLNPYMGFREMSRQAQKIAHEKGIENYYFYKFRSGENLDAYLHQEVTSRSMEEIAVLSKQQDFLLFVRNKELQREQELAVFLENKKSYIIGNYRIFIFQTN